MYEGDDLNTLDDAPPPEESGNKTFMLVAADSGRARAPVHCMRGCLRLILDSPPDS